MSSPKTTIQQAPTTPAPSASESAADLYRARLEYEPQIAEHEYQLEQKYLPLQVQQQADLYAQYAPQITAQNMALQKEYAPQQRELEALMYPQQTQLVEAMSGQALQRMNNPYGYSADEQSALDAIRQRQRDQLVESMRTQANLGGGLYGGRSRNQELQQIMGLNQGFADQDINRKLQAAQQALQYAVPVAQIAYPQIQSPGMPQTQYPVQNAVTPSADTLYNAMYGASQPQQYATQSSDRLGQFMGLAGQLGGSALLASSIRYKENVRPWARLLN